MLPSCDQCGHSFIIWNAERAKDAEKARSPSKTVQETKYEISCEMQADALHLRLCHEPREAILAGRRCLRLATSFASPSIQYTPWLATVEADSSGHHRLEHLWR